MALKSIDAINYLQTAIYRCYSAATSITMVQAFAAIKIYFINNFLHISNKLGNYLLKYASAELEEKQTNCTKWKTLY